MVDKVFDFIVLGLIAIVSTILGQRKKIKLLLVIGTLLFPVIGLGVAAARVTAWVIVISNRSIAIDTYATRIATMVGGVVFVYTVIWFVWINSVVDAKTQQVATEWEAKENNKGEKGDGS